MSVSESQFFLTCAAPREGWSVKKQMHQQSTMNRTFLLVGLACLFSGTASASQPALTIYNQDFAVVRDTVPLNLKAGVNQVSFTGATAYLEPSSVVLRDPAGKEQFQILKSSCATTSRTRWKFALWSTCAAGTTGP